MHDVRTPPDHALPDDTPRLAVVRSDADADELVLRSLVYVSRNPDDALVEHLRARRWSVHVERCANDAARRLKLNRPQVGIVDFEGIASRELPTLETLLAHQQVGWIAIAGDNRLNDAKIRRLIRQFCFDYAKELPPEALFDYLVDHAYGMVALCDLDSDAWLPQAESNEMVGACDAMQQLFRTIRKIALTDATVFISGESGTGKELSALAIHERSARGKAPFVAINCGAIPPNLLQSELFGYERGAFTGANQRKIGRVEAAAGGTLFLDEIGDMPLESQASMLRFLQEGKIERLGGREPIPVDVRIVSATHVDIEAAIREGRFREDLYHRLCVLRLDIPALRARGKDIEILAHRALHKFGGDSARQIRGFTSCAIEAMYRYSWPGNVRELINRIRRAIVLSDSCLISAADLDLAQFVTQHATTLAQARDIAEHRAIEASLLRHRGHLAEAATELGVSCTALSRLMAKYGLPACSVE
ncbi:bacterial regulatory, Fis family protein [Burkholderia thailandensis USAMRU Malaysia |uniref:Sigma-54 dependent DNA-binding transcriptional regulator n=1 Tax=Burkholderia thailandensis (strain ATCC 700388 / DSM 13276 / CCUG 48851 / CIP 106301 / E264) TaxID=271848 RepID=Q2T009_BURTA|nr:sigma-54 dependent DNA-binding transcriptional regulator [Burkholderia thailandensis E264]AHI73410.1 bacterial regulatory, Fis family protein [Burkholderia thailandensis 2002721723]AHI78677.1 bacterial regulatory, Fis family protein [Burkholderia thailandensis E444]AIC86236.1 bacterial regulatory, Fis family protein [Burkholderia thailandensis USAMRU Malaysia \